MRAVAKQQHRRLGEIHAHGRLADGEARQLGTHFGNHRRCAVYVARLGFFPLGLRRLGVVLFDRRQHIVHCPLAGAGRLAPLCMTGTQAPLVPAQLLRQTLGSRVEGQVGL